MTTATKVKERPILYSGPMVRATLEDRKTQTRRIVNPLCHSDEVKVILRNECVWVSLSDEQIDADNPNNTVYGAPVYYAPDSTAYGEIRVGMGPKGEGNPCRCPYGKPGDRLWGKEALIRHNNCVCYAAEYPDEAVPVPDPDDPDRPARWRWKRATLPSMFMPRWASRILLELTDIRVERLQEISEADIRAEGFRADDATPTCVQTAASYGMDVLRHRFASLWDSINGPGSWDANPWVWALTFKRI